MGTRLKWDRAKYFGKPTLNIKQEQQWLKNDCAARFIAGARQKSKHTRAKQKQRRRKAMRKRCRNPSRPDEEAVWQKRIDSKNELISAAHLWLDAGCAPLLRTLSAMWVPPRAAPGPSIPSLEVEDVTRG
jgi:hypothetical protein